MAFLSPIRNRFQKKKRGRSKNASDEKKSQLTKSSSPHNSSQRTVLSVSEITTSRSSFEGKPGVVESSLYGYELAAPDTPIRNGAIDFATNDYDYEHHNPSARPRRSSMKGSTPGPRHPEGTRRRRHSISFQDEVKVTEVVPLSTLANSKGDLWLQGEDYYNIVNKVHAIVDRTVNGQGPKYCVRGLEHLIQPQDAPKSEAWDAVLDEQQFQQTTGRYDDERLSRKYRSSSIQSRMDAKIRAQKDENEVAKYLEDTRKYCRRMSL